MRKSFYVSLCVLAVAIGGCRKPSATEHIGRATKFVDESRLPEAIVEYRLALQADPKLGDVRLKLGDLYVRSGDGKNALAEYVRASDLLPDSLDAQLKAGNLLLLAQAFEDAKGRADRAIQIDPKSVDAQILRGNALAGLRDLDGAMNEYQEAIALNPNGEVAYRNLGTLQFAKGKREDAEATFKKAVETAPQSIQARLALANFYWASNRVPEAQQTLEEALEIDHDNLQANRALGLFYVASGRVAEAEPFFIAIARIANSPEAKFTLSDYYAGVKRYDEARKLLNKLAEDEKSYAAASVRLASLDAVEQNRAGALSRLHEVLTKYPRDASAHLVNARLLLIDGKRDEALAEVNTVITNDSSSPAAVQAYFLAGQIYTGSDRFEDAIRSFEEVLKRDPRPLAATLALARLNLVRRTTDQAVTYAQQALAMEPANPEAQSLLVRARLASGNLSQAKSDLADLEKAYPKSATVANLRAAVHLSEKHIEPARASYMKALELASNNFEAFTGLVQLDLATNRAKEATALIDRQLQVAKPSVEVIVLAARVYGGIGNDEKAENLLRQAIETDPGRLQPYSLLGQLYVSQNRIEEAKDRFREVIKRDPKSVSANTMLAMLLEQQGRLGEAEKEYQRVLSIDSRAAVASNNLAWIYVASNRNLDDALQLAQTAYQQAPNEPNINDTLGWIYYRKNLFSQAIPHLETSVQKSPDDATFNYHLGMAYVQTGDWKRARTALKQAITLKPDFEGAPEAAKALATIGA